MAPVTCVDAYSASSSTGISRHPWDVHCAKVGVCALPSFTDEALQGWLLGCSQLGTCKEPGEGGDEKVTWPLATTTEAVLQGLHACTVAAQTRHHTHTHTLYDCCVTITPCRTRETTTGRHPSVDASRLWALRQVPGGPQQGYQDQGPDYYVHSAKQAYMHTKS